MSNESIELLCRTEYHLLISPNEVLLFNVPQVSFLCTRSLMALHYITDELR